MARQIKKQEPAFKRVMYSREGPIEELRGQKFDVPVTVSNPGSWIESQHRELKARELAEAERAKREADVLRDRQAAVIAAERQEQERNAVTAEIEAVKAELRGLRGELSTPDAERLVQMNAQTVVAMGRTLDATERVDGLLERLETAEARIELLNAEAVEAREVSLQLVRNYQQLLNGVQESNGKLINEYSARYVEAAQEAIQLSERIGANWETVQNAAQINETAIAQATAASKEMLLAQHEEFLAAMNIALGAIGVTQEDLDRELLRQRDDQASKVPLLTTSYLAEMVALSRKVREAREDADQRTNLAASTKVRPMFVAGR